MQLIAVNAGLPREVDWNGKPILTSIFKRPVAGPVAVKGQNVVGDRQADLRYHGGVDKAVYGYPSEHYPFWREAYPDLEDGWGLFGENLTTTGLTEDRLHIGDVLRIGTVKLRVSQPRMPCFKLGIRHGKPDLIKAFQKALRPGFYLRIEREGTLEAGDSIEVTHSVTEAPTVREIVELQRPPARDRAAIERALALQTLGPEWRVQLEKRLAEASA